MEIVVVVGAVENVEITQSRLFISVFLKFHVWNKGEKRFDEMWKAFSAFIRRIFAFFHSTHRT